MKIIDPLLFNYGTKTKDLIELECEICRKTFTKRKGDILQTLKKITQLPENPVGDDRYLRNRFRFCSRKCANLFHGKSRTTKPCSACGKPVSKFNFYAKLMEKGVYKNCFCSRICRNRFGIKTGTNSTPSNRSKLEIDLEKHLRYIFPDLKIKCNDRKVLFIGELDFYFPELNYAIELNGEYHFRDIHNDGGLKKRQGYDKIKKALCKNKNISLRVIDTRKITTASCNEFFNSIVSEITLAKQPR